MRGLYETSADKKRGDVRQPSRLETLKSSEPAAARKTRRSRVGSWIAAAGARSPSPLPAFSSLLFLFLSLFFFVFLPSRCLFLPFSLFAFLSLLFPFPSALKRKDRSHQMFFSSRTLSTFRSFSDFEATNSTQSLHRPRRQILPIR